jgi:hypothetical protein
MVFSSQLADITHQQVTGTSCKVYLFVAHRGEKDGDESDGVILLD